MFMITNLIEPPIGKLILNHLIGNHCPESRNGQIINGQKLILFKVKKAAFRPSVANTSVSFFDLMWRFSFFHHPSDIVILLKLNDRYFNHKR